VPSKVAIGFGFPPRSQIGEKKPMAKPTKTSPANSSLTRPPQPTHGSEISSRTPTYEQIAVRAYEIFLARGGEPGRDQDDWYQAERELLLGRQ
jgi:hypothetical protein